MGSNVGVTPEQRQAIAVAVAMAAAAEAATAQVAVEVVRRPSNFVREHCAAIAIQTAFKGYLVRTALYTIYTQREYPYVYVYIKLFTTNLYVL